MTDQVVRDLTLNASATTPVDATPAACSPPSKPFDWTPELLARLHQEREKHTTEGISDWYAIADAVGCTAKQARNRTHGERAITKSNCTSELIGPTAAAAHPQGPQPYVVSIDHTSHYASANLSVVSLPTGGLSPNPVRVVAIDGKPKFVCAGDLGILLGNRPGNLTAYCLYFASPSEKIRLHHSALGSNQKMNMLTHDGLKRVLQSDLFAKLDQSRRSWIESLWETANVAATASTPTSRKRTHNSTTQSPKKKQRTTEEEDWMPLSRAALQDRIDSNFKELMLRARIAQRAADKDKGFEVKIEEQDMLASITQLIAYMVAPERGWVLKQSDQILRFQ